MEDINKAETFSVLLSNPNDLEIMKLSKALSVFYKQPQQDMITKVKACWGLVENNISEDEAKSIQGALLQSDIPTQITETTKIKLLNKADIKNEGNFIFEENLKFTLIAAAAIEEKKITIRKEKTGPSAGAKIASMGIMLATGLPIKIGGKTKEIEIKKEQNDWIYFLDLYTTEGDHYRIDAQNFNYSALKEKKKYSLMENFKTLIFLINEKFPTAIKNKGTKYFLKNKPLREMGYETLSDLERESQWLLTLAA